MTGEQVARLFNARGNRGRWRARCPCHKSRGLTLAIYEGNDWVMLTCFAGCAYEDILASVGLTKRDLALRERVTDPKLIRAAELQRRQEEALEAQHKARFRYLCDQAWCWERIVQALPIGTPLWHGAVYAARVWFERRNRMGGYKQRKELDCTTRVKSPPSYSPFLVTDEEYRSFIRREDANTRIRTS